MLSSELIVHDTSRFTNPKVHNRTKLEMPYRSAVELAVLMSYGLELNDAFHS